MVPFSSTVSVSETLFARARQLIPGGVNSPVRGTSSFRPYPVYLERGDGAHVVDVDGNLWVGWGMGKEGLDGVSIFNPQGMLIGRIDLPERCANLCFGGRHRNRLFMCGSTSLYSLFVNTQGVSGG